VRPIAPTQRIGSTGPEVAALQEALLRLIVEKVIRALDPPNQPTAEQLKALTEQVRGEQADGVFGDATGQLVRWFQIQNGLGDGLDGVVEERTADRLNEILRALGLLDDEPTDPPDPTDPDTVFTVAGHVEGSRPGLVVRAFDQDFRTEQPMGDGPIRTDGRYEVRYTAAQFSHAEKGTADLRVAVVDDGGNELVSSDVVFNAGPTVEIDLVVPANGDGGPTEVERHLAVLAEVMEGVSLLEVARGAPAQRQRDVDFLAADTGIARDHVAGLVLAFELSAPDDGAPRPRPEVFYGWLRRDLPGDWDALLALPTTTLRAALVSAVDQRIVPRWVLDQLDATIGQLPNPDRGDLDGLLAAAAWPADRVGAVLAHVDGLDAVSDETLGRLVDDRTLRPTEAQQLGLSVSLHRLGDGAPALVGTMLRTDFPAVPGKRLRQVRDLAVLEPDDWQRSLKAAGIDPPAGTTAADHARGLALQAAGAFPDAAFRSRAAALPAGLDDAARRMQPVFERNPDALTTAFDDLDLEGIPDRDRAALRPAHTTLRNLAHDHPGLGLAGVFAASPGAEAAKTATRLVGRLADVLARNPDVDLLALDYLPGSLDVAALDFGDMPAADRDLVLADLRASQRVHSVTLNPIVSQQVKRAGIHSASAMAMQTPLQLAATLGVSQAEARAYHGRALERANAAALDWFRLYEEARDHTTTPVRAIPSRHQFFHRLTGFRQLFEDQPWCACDDCQSVLSPAAYLVDLLHYIERWILAESFAGPAATHPLHLERRRPDLWDLELTCAATKTSVPTLDIVNEVLERYLIDVRPDGVALADAAAVHAFLADQEGALNLPFTLPLERLRVLLEHFGVTRHDVARALRTTPAVQARAALDLSTREYALVTQPRTDGAYLGRLFGLGGSANTTGPDAVVPPVELTGLLGATGLTHGDLVTLLEARFVSRDGSTVAPVDVVLEKSPGAVQNDTERVHNLTVRRLDRLHRFFRLWRKLPWTIDELDLVVERLGGGATPAVIAAPATSSARGTLERIVDLLDLAARWELPVDELLAIVDTIPLVGLRQAPPLFDRLFNPAPFVARDGRWPPAAAVRFSHPGWARRTGPGGGAPGTSSPPDNTLTRLLAGLQLSDQDFVELVAGLTGVAALDHRPATATADESIVLSRASLDALHRHARLRALLGVPVRDFLDLLSLATPAGALATVDDVVAVADLAAWQETSGFGVAELRALVPRNPAGGVLGIGDPELVARVDAIVAAVDPARLALEPDPLHVLDVAIGDIAERPADVVARLRQLADPLDAAARAAVVRALQGTGSTADTTRLRALVMATLRHQVLFRNPVFDVRSLTFVGLHPEVFFGSTAAGPTATGPAAVTLAVVRNVVAYAARAGASDAGFTTEAAAVDRDALEAAVLDPGAADPGAVAAVLRIDAAAVAALRPHLPLPADPFAALDALARGLELTGLLGVSGETLARMTTESSTPATTFAALSRAAEDVFGAFRAKYRSEATFREKVEPYEDELRGRRRDGLVAYITHRWPEPFVDADALYQYFLIDVQVGGCARTTRVVAAMSSLQLYVERVLMNLERSDDWDGRVPPQTGVYARFSDARRRGEWWWRKQFRVWEANRKVFLYPENYIEPELRDDKTPLFTELEDSLLVQRIDGATVGDAYTSYLSGFDELARLKVAGTFYDQANRTLHLFGVTQDDAPVFYYRSLTERGTAAKPQPPLYSGWQRLGLQIPARKVSPILFEGRLYLFWVETATRPVSTLKDGGSEFSGYRHTVRVKYSMLRLDGRWSAPQLVHMEQADGIGDARIVEDPLDTQVIDGMKAERKQKEEDLVTAKGKVTEADAAWGKADKEWRDAVTSRDAKRKTFFDLFPLGVMPVDPTGISIAIWAGLLADWQLAVTNERNRFEARRLADDALRNAVNHRQQLDDRIAVLTAAIDAEVVRVRWDKSSRDHKDALDSYRPQGWEWDRVYPDAYRVGTGTAARDALRLMLVPRNPPELTTTDPAVVTGIAARPIRSGDLDVATAVLREMSTGETATLRWGTRLNWSAGTVRSLVDTAMAYDGQQFFADALWLERPATPGQTVGHAPLTAEVQAVNGWPGSAIVEVSGDAVWMRQAGGAGASGATGYAGLRLSTSLTRSLAREFWRDGPRSLLDPLFQLGLTEARSTISPVAGQSDPKRANPLHPDNPFLTYYRETFFHIPFLIADHLNGQQDFSGAQSWYHHVFDPTAADGEPWRFRSFRVPDLLTTSLKDLLTKEQALEAYRNDPFSPHAIARVRGGTYQKTIVMKYVDNLLDWGDALFGQFTTESLNEATMLYVMAREILGPRPAELGSCLAEGAPRNYRSIRAGLTDVSDFLVELETPPAPAVLNHRPAAAEAGVLVIDVGAKVTQFAQAQVRTLGLARGAAGFGPGDGFDPGAGEGLGLGFGGDTVAITPALASAGVGGGGTVTLWTNDSGTPLTTMYGNGNGTGGIGVNGGFGIGGGEGDGGVRIGNQVAPIDFVEGHDLDLAQGFRGTKLGVPGGDTIVPFGDLDIKYDLRDVIEFDPGKYWPGGHDGRFDHVPFDPVEVVPPKDALFCIPPNQDLLAYWDRVESRLFNIRNCMDIAGVRRVPELFAPELDVRMLVRMKAAGLSLDDVLAATAGDLPPYRFGYIVEKARQYVATVQAFGAQLQAALEKRDAEELSHLRAVHDQNLLKMATRTNRMEIAAAEATLESLRRQKLAAENRRDHYMSLATVGSLPQETKQQELQRFGADLLTAAGIAEVVASILTVIPDVGAWTAMKFGGSQLGAAGKAVAEGIKAVASFNEAMASRSGVEAANQRRDQDWRFQAESARRDIAQLDKSITAAEIRRDIAVHALEVHERSVAQTEEMFEFFREKFSSTELYRLLAVELRRVYRMAFNDALAMARLAEQAFRSERPDDAAEVALSGDYWDAATAGLLAGERLLVDLQALERRYVERNHRQLEVDQSFSLAQFAPEALATLQLTGECSFDVPEWFFDLSYPGQYRRRLRAVRMTVPCVVGPHANVGATLRLTGSEIRQTIPDDLTHGLGGPTTVPAQQAPSIATSRGQNDAGVFEFSFRDERYMPFEGAGAVSSWHVALPRTVRSFDYSTISDVILHLSYTAEHDEDLRDLWDGTARDLLDLLRAVPDPAGDGPLLVHRFSLRTDFPDAFHRLLTGPAGTAVGFAIDERHLPLFVGDQVATVDTAVLSVVSTASSLTGTALGIARKPVGTALPSYKDYTGPAGPDTGTAVDALRSFDGDVLASTAGGAGLSGALEGQYLLKLTAPGPLATAGAVDPHKLRDITLTVGYHLTSP